jgi:uncharacterized protein YxjI
MTQPDPTAAPSPFAGSRFHLRQKITPFQNTYRVFADANGEPGPLVAFAKQKRLAFKESFTLYSDESATWPILAIKADRTIDFRSAMTVSEPVSGAPIGVLRKKGAQSLIRSTWELEQPGMPLVTITERSAVVAVLRRVWGLIPYANNVPVPWVFHFDGTSGETQILSHTRLWGIRDRYVLEVHVPALDRRLAIALAICLDAMQSR